jgi:hypothetical protein
MLTGFALLCAAGFFGYMLALLQRRLFGMASTTDVSLSNRFYLYPALSSPSPPPPKKKEKRKGDIGTFADKK